MPSYNSQTENIPYEYIYEQIKAGLKVRFPPEVAHHNPEFEHSAANRIRIYMVRERIKGTHYEICFRRTYYEFALHFESTSAISMKRCQAFDPYIQEITRQVEQYVKSGPLENKGWRRIWYEQCHVPIGQEQIQLYIDQYSRFIGATFPILMKVFDL